MMYTEDQVKAMLAKSDELHTHTEDHLMGIIRKYQSDLGIAVEALEKISVIAPETEQDFALWILAKIRGEG